MKPWKRPHQAPVGGPTKGLQWGHGDEAVEEAANQLLITPRVKLQWGHGDEAVEEAVIKVKTADLNSASMGPRR